VNPAVSFTVTHGALMDQVGTAYAAVRTRITQLTRDLDEAAGMATVPTCPRWTVHDVVAHLAGVADDALAGRLEGVATDPWTQAQVDARRGEPIDAMLADWEAAAAFEDLLDHIGPPGRQAVLDAVSHEHDIRTALGCPGARDSDAVMIGYDFIATVFIGSAQQQGIPIRTRGIGADDHGPADAALRLDGSAFDLMRAMTGRRSVDQLRGMAWSGSGTCEDALVAFTYGPFRPAAVAIDE
jgi:uncharacterized protein (TIGR03083 family)